MNGYGVITVSKDESGRLIVAFPYDPQLVTKVKTIEYQKCYPAPYVIARSEDSSPVIASHQRWRSNLNTLLEQAPQSHFKDLRREIYTHVSTKSLGKIQSPLDSLNLKKGGSN